MTSYWRSILGVLPNMLRRLFRRGTRSSNSVQESGTSRDQGYIQLDRKFIERKEEEVKQSDYDPATSQSRPNLGWPDITGMHRVVILASAGAGKTCELKTQCEKLHSEGKPSFFFYLEHLADGFHDGLFEGRDAQRRFEQAIKKDEDMWLFLDAVDEAKLKGHSAFDRALRNLKTHIENPQKVHIILTGRAGECHPEADTDSLRHAFPYRPASKSEPAIRHLDLLGLDAGQMKKYVDEKGVSNASELVSEISRRNMENLAMRPKDLDDIITFWEKNGTLGIRSEMVKESIERKLKEHNPKHDHDNPLTLDRVRAGAEKLAASVILSQKTKIIGPGRSEPSDSLPINSVLSDWRSPECRSLINREIFEPELYGFVRFDHRESREYLAAYWFHHLMKQRQSHRQIKGLFFKRSHGLDIIVPSLRPVLPWLALLEPFIKDHLLGSFPEVLLEGGDPASFAEGERKQILEGYCARCDAGEVVPTPIDRNILRSLVSPGFADTIQSLYSKYAENEEIQRFLLEFIEIGEINDLSQLVKTVATGPRQPREIRRAAMRAVAKICNEMEVAFVRDSLSEDPCLKRREELADLIDAFGHKRLSLEMILRLIADANASEEGTLDELDLQMQSYAKECSLNELRQIVSATAKLIKEYPYIEEETDLFEVSEKHAWMLGFMLRACERLIEANDPVMLEESVLSILSLTRIAWGHASYTGTNIETLVPESRDLNGALFWYDIRDLRRMWDKYPDRRVASWQVASIRHGLWRFTVAHFEEILPWIREEEFRDDQLVALTLACDLYRDAGRPDALMIRLQEVIKGDDRLEKALGDLLAPPLLAGIAEQYESVAKAEKDAAVRKAELREMFSQNLDKIRWAERPPEEGSVWKIQALLFSRMQKRDEDRTRYTQSNWRDLVDEFGEDIAKAMRDGLMVIWKDHRPVLASEVGYQPTTHPQIQSMGLSGIEIVSREKEDWLDTLRKDGLAEHVVRYLFAEINKFPSWFKSFEEEFPEVTLAVIEKEIEWELFKCEGAESLNYVLSNIAWHEPWYDGRIAPKLLESLKHRNPSHPDSLRRALTIISRCGAIRDEDIALIASQRAEDSETADEYRALWYAAWVSVEPSHAIPSLERALKELEDSRATELAISFINALTRSRMDRGINVRENYKTADALKDLYLLMCQYIRREDDIDHSGEGLMRWGRGNLRKNPAILFSESLAIALTNRLLKHLAK